MSLWVGITDLPQGGDSWNVTSYNNLIWIATGWTRNSEQLIYSYDPDTGAYTQKTNAPQPLAYGNSGRIGNKWYFAAPYNSGNKTYAYYYDLDNDTWTQIADTLFGAGDGYGFAVGSKFYVIGGWDDNITGGGHGKVQIYDPAIDTWSLGTDAPVVISYYTGVVDGTDIYTFGGYSQNPALDISTIYKYNTLTDTWSHVTNLPVAVEVAGSAVIGRIAYIISGYQGNTAYSTQNYSFDLDTHAVATESQYPIGVWGGAVVNYNNTLYGFGGYWNDAPTGEDRETAHSYIFSNQTIASTARGTGSAFDARFSIVPNDYLEEAQEITGTFGIVKGTLKQTHGDPGRSGGYPSENFDVYYKFIPQSTGTYSFAIDYSSSGTYPFFYINIPSDTLNANHWERIYGFLTFNTGTAYNIRVASDEEVDFTIGWRKLNEVNKNEKPDDIFGIDMKYVDHHILSPFTYETGITSWTERLPCNLEAVGMGIDPTNPDIRFLHMHRMHSNQNDGRVYTKLIGGSVAGLSGPIIVDVETTGQITPMPSGYTSPILRTQGLEYGEYQILPMSAGKALLFQIGDLLHLPAGYGEYYRQFASSMWATLINVDFAGVPSLAGQAHRIIDIIKETPSVSSTGLYGFSDLISYSGVGRMYNPIKLSNTKAFVANDANGSTSFQASYASIITIGSDIISSVQINDIRDNENHPIIILNGVAVSDTQMLVAYYRINSDPSTWGTRIGLVDLSSSTFTMTHSVAYKGLGYTDYSEVLEKGWNTVRNGKTWYIIPLKNYTVAVRLIGDGALGTLDVDDFNRRASYVDYEPDGAPYGHTQGGKRYLSSDPYTNRILIRDGYLKFKCPVAADSIIALESFSSNIQFSIELGDDIEQGTAAGITIWEGYYQTANGCTISYRPGVGTSVENINQHTKTLIWNDPGLIFAAGDRIGARVIENNLVVMKNGLDQATITIDLTAPDFSGISGTVGIYSDGSEVRFKNLNIQAIGPIAIEYISQVLDTSNLVITGVSNLTTHYSPELDKYYQIGLGGWQNHDSFALNYFACADFEPFAIPSFANYGNIISLPNGWATYDNINSVFFSGQRAIRVGQNKIMLVFDNQFQHGFYSDINEASQGFASTTFAFFDLEPQTIGFDGPFDSKYTTSNTDTIEQAITGRYKAYNGVLYGYNNEARFGSLIKFIHSANTQPETLAINIRNETNLGFFTSVAVVDETSVYLAGIEDGVKKIWHVDLSSHPGIPSEVLNLGDDGQKYVFLAIDKIDNTIVYCSSNKIYRWDPTGGSPTLIHTLPPYECGPVAVSKDGAIWVVTGKYNDSQVFDVTRLMIDERVYRINPNDNSVLDFAPASDKDQISTWPWPYSGNTAEWQNSTVNDIDTVDNDALLVWSDLKEGYGLPPHTAPEWSGATDGVTGWQIEKQHVLNQSSLLNYPTDIAFNSNGTRMFIADTYTSTVARIYQYDLSSPWDITSAVYNGVLLAIYNGFGVYAEDGNLHISFGNNGQYLYMSSVNGAWIVQCTLSTSYDLSGAFVGGPITSPSVSGGKVNFNANGTIAWVDVSIFSLSTPWIFSTATYSNTISDLLSRANTTVSGFNSTNSWVYNSNGSKIYQFGQDPGLAVYGKISSSTTWGVGIDFSHAIQLPDYYEGDTNTAFVGLAVSPDESKFYFLDKNNKKIFQYGMNLDARTTNIPAWTPYNFSNTNGMVLAYAISGSGPQINAGNVATVTPVNLSVDDLDPPSVEIVDTETSADLGSPGSVIPDMIKLTNNYLVIVSSHEPNKIKASLAYRNTDVETIWSDFVLVHPDDGHAYHYCGGCRVADNKVLIIYTDSTDPAKTYAVTLSIVQDAGSGSFINPVTPLIIYSLTQIAGPGSSGDRRGMPTNESILVYQLDSSTFVALFGHRVCYMIGVYGYISSYKWSFIGDFRARFSFNGSTEGWVSDLTDGTNPNTVSYSSTNDIDGIGGSLKLIGGYGSTAKSPLISFDTNTWTFMELAMREANSLWGVIYHLSDGSTIREGGDSRYADESSDIVWYSNDGPFNHHVVGAEIYAGNSSVVYPSTRYIDSALFWTQEDDVPGFIIDAQAITSNTMLVIYNAYSLGFRAAVLSFDSNGNATLNTSLGICSGGMLQSVPTSGIKRTIDGKFDVIIPTFDGPYSIHTKIYRITIDGTSIVSVEPLITDAIQENQSDLFVWTSDPTYLLAINGWQGYPGGNMYHMWHYDNSTGDLSIDYMSSLGIPTGGEALVNIKPLVANEFAAISGPVYDSETSTVRYKLYFMKLNINVNNNHSGEWHEIINQPRYDPNNGALIGRIQVWWKWHKKSDSHYEFTNDIKAYGIIVLAGFDKVNTSNPIDSAVCSKYGDDTETGLGSTFQNDKWLISPPGAVVSCYGSKVINIWSVIGYAGGGSTPPVWNRSSLGLVGISNQYGGAIASDWTDWQFPAMPRFPNNLGLSVGGTINVLTTSIPYQTMANAVIVLRGY